MAYLKFQKQVSEAFSPVVYSDQVHSAERELSTFVSAVAALYGPEQAKLSTEDWLDKSDLIDCPPRSEARNCHAVTIAASVRLAHGVRVGAAPVEVRQNIDH